MWVINHEDFRPELSFMVMDGGELVGLSVNKVRDAENAAKGIKEGWIQSLGVRARLATAGNRLRFALRQHACFQSCRFGIRRLIRRYR